MARYLPEARDTGRFGSARLAVLTISACVLVLAAVALGAWWWSLRSVSDPIDANPVSSTAVVVASPACADGGGTVVHLSGADPHTYATLDGCGFPDGQRIAVEYLAGDPGTVRLSGTSRAGQSTLIRKILPIGMLVAGFASVVMLAIAAAGRRGRRRAVATPLAVADLRARILAARTAAAPPAGSTATGQAHAPPARPAATDQAAADPPAG